jgi:hypothetical protein
MTSPPSGISEADWLSWPAAARAFILAQQQEIRAQREDLQVLRQGNEQMRQQLTALAAELASLRERIGRNSRNSSKPPSSDRQGFKPPLKRKGSGRKRGGQPGHPGSGPELLPVERCESAHDHVPDTCRRCGNPLSGVDPAPHRHQVIDIPPIQAEVIEHRLHRLLCPRCSTSTCAELPQGVETSHYGPRLSSLVGLLGSAFPLSIGKTSELLERLLGVSISGGAIVAIRARLAACLREPMEEALREARLQPVVYMDETGAPTGNADGGNPDGRRGWLWVLMTPMLTVFSQGLSRSSAAAMELLGPSFGGIVVSDRFSAYNQLPLEQRQLCWAHIVRDLTAIAERPGASAEMGTRLLNLRHQLFEHWHRWKAGVINRKQLRQQFRPIRAEFVQTLRRVVELGHERGEQTPWSQTVRTCQQLLQRQQALWTFLDHDDVEPTNNGAERALRPAVIQRKISYGVQSKTGALCRIRLLTVCTSLQQQGRDLWGFLEQAWMAHRHGGEMPSMIPND